LIFVVTYTQRIIGARRDEPDVPQKTRRAPGIPTRKVRRKETKRRKERVRRIKETGLSIKGPAGIASRSNSSL
jgi:hypothetical protein